MQIPNTQPIERALTAMNSTRDDSKIEHNFTTRDVRAILIAGDQADCPGTPTPGAMTSLDIIEQHLTSRFAPGDIKIERIGGSPTRQRVASAFQSMMKFLESGELFVVMFAGHGIPACRVEHAQSWSLTAGEAFTDVDLAAALLALPPGVDTVVLSDCCFGEGLFQVEPRGDRPSGQRPRNSPMVCISAAGKNNLVELAKLATLATQTVAAADAMHSYRQLSRTFAAQAVAGCTFHVDARPAHRLDDLVLSPQRGRPVIVDRRPPDDSDRQRSTVCARARFEPSSELTPCQEPSRSGA